MANKPKYTQQQLSTHRTYYDAIPYGHLWSEYVKLRKQSE